MEGGIQPDVSLARTSQRLGDQLFGVAAARLEPHGDLPGRQALEVVEAEHLPVVFWEACQDLAHQKLALQAFRVTGRRLFDERHRSFGLVRMRADSPVRPAHVAHRGDEPRPRAFDLDACIEKGEEGLLDEGLGVAVGHVELAAGDVEQKVPVGAVQGLYVFRAQPAGRLVR
jgi:hypothetical protein